MGFLLSVTHGFFLEHENEPEYTHDGIDLKTNNFWQKEGQDLFQGRK